MKIINREIFRISIELISLICLIVFTYFWWSKLNITQYADFVKQGSKPSLELKLIQRIENYNLFPLSDELAIENIMPGIIRVENYTSVAKNYNLIFMIDKNDTTLDYNIIKVSINDEIYYLKDIDREEDMEVVYFIFNEDTVKDYKDYQIRIWMDEEAKESDGFRKYFSYSFSLKDNNYVI